jgi:hypothetical protein
MKPSKPSKTLEQNHVDDIVLERAVVIAGVNSMQSFSEPSSGRVIFLLSAFINFWPQTIHTYVQ